MSSSGSGSLGRFGVAVRLLTRLPVPGAEHDGPDDLRAAAPFFPLVGLVVGGVGVVVRAAGGWALGPVPGTVLAVAAMVAVTGAFHEDGLADTFDGLFGATTPERRLEVMRDSRIGTYGASALVLALGLRVALLAPLSLGAFARAVLAGHVAGRAAGVVLASTLAAAPGSTQGVTVAGASGRSAGAAVATAGVVVAWAAGWWFAVPLVAAAVVAVAMRAVAKAKVGGITGDVLGAATVLVELAVMAGVVR